MGNTPVSAITFGSCYAGSVFMSLKNQYWTDLKLVSRVLHNRLDQFNNCFIRGTSRSLEWNDIYPYLSTGASESDISDLKLYIRNQSQDCIGRHAIDSDSSFFNALADHMPDLIIIDNFMDVAAKLLASKNGKNVIGFANWSYLDFTGLATEYDILDFISSSNYLLELETFLVFLRILAPTARIIFLPYPGVIEGHEEKQAIINSREINAKLSICSEALVSQFGIQIVNSRPLCSKDLTNAKDWSHYASHFYNEIADKIYSCVSLDDHKNYSTDGFGAMYKSGGITSDYSVGVIIQFFNDFDHIQSVIEKLAWVDEIVINDGPFSFTEELFGVLFGPFDNYQKYASEYFQRLALLLGVKISYSYSVFRDEHDKRCAGYEMIESDILLSVDSDEILDITRESLRQFWRSDAAVGGFKCINLTRFGLLIFQHPSNAILSINDLPNKPFCFKRKIVSSSDHINYLWLVGISQGARVDNFYFDDEICQGLHLTNIRSDCGAAVKFGFYTSLWFKTHNKEKFGPFADCILYLGEGSRLSKASMHNILAGASQSSVGVPNQFSLCELGVRISGTLEKALNEVKYGFYPNEQPLNADIDLLPGIPRYFNLSAKTNLFELTFSHDASIIVRVHFSYFNRPPELTTISSEPIKLTVESSALYSLSLKDFIFDTVFGTEHLASEEAGIQEAPRLMIIEVCCWMSDQEKNLIRTTGIPVRLSLRGRIRQLQYPN